jgi:transcriptional regulator with XRE-family HTH domain
MNLKEWRIGKGLTMEEAADLFGISQPTISRIERGVLFPSIALVERLGTCSKGAICITDLQRTWRDARTKPRQARRA